MCRKQSFFPFFHRILRVTSTCIFPPDPLDKYRFKIVSKSRLSSLGPSPDRAPCLNPARLTVFRQGASCGVDFNSANQPFRTSDQAQAHANAASDLWLQGLQTMRCRTENTSAVPTSWSGCPQSSTRHAMHVQEEQHRYADS
jgi:hypothetical protein